MPQLDSKAFAILTVFLVFQVVQPLLMTNMKKAGVPSTRIENSWVTFLFIIPHYYAMVPVGFLPSKSSLADMTAKEWKVGFWLASADLINQLMSKVGLMMTGAGVYMLVNSSSMIWTVALSMIILGTRPSLQQFIGIMLVFVGLSMKVLESLGTNNGFASAQELPGICLIICASILDGGVFVFQEKFQTGASAIPGPQLTCIQGMCTSAMLTVWTLCFTLSGSSWKNYVMDGVSLSCEGKGIDCIADQGRTIVYCLYFLFMANVFTSSTVWWLLTNVGAVTFVVVKALKIVLVVTLSHIIYCSEDKAECISPLRISQVALCVAGVVIYSLSPKRKPAVGTGNDEEARDASIIAANAAGISFMSSGSVRKECEGNRSFHGTNGDSDANRIELQTGDNRVLKVRPSLG